MIDECSSVYKRNGITIGRPMSERTTREIYFYLYNRKLIDFSFDKFEWVKSFYSQREQKMIGEGSINKLLANFVQNLSDTYYSTSFNLLKVLPRIKNQIGEGEKCELCQYQCRY